MSIIKNKYLDTIYELRGKRVYVEVVNPFFQCISDIGIVNAIVPEEENKLEIYGEYDDLTLFELGFKVDFANDLEDDDEEDRFLFKLKYPISNTYLYFFEYEDEEED